jgi:hypothetical protein
MKAALALTVLAAALAGCATDTTTTSGSSRTEPVVRQMPYKPGTGVVQSWSAAPSPAAGASGRVDPRSAASGSGMLRLGIKMDDGTVQYVDTESRDFPIGTRVQLTQDHVIKRP